MHSESEWREVYWGLVTELENRIGSARLEADVHSLASAFAQHMKKLEEEDRHSERLMPYEEKIDRIAGEFLNLFFDRPHSATGRDIRTIMRQAMRSKAREMLEAIRARVGEESGIAY